MNKKVDKLSGISHEMRNCLTNVKEAVSLVADGVMGRVNQKQVKMLKLAGDNIERLSRLSDQALDFSKMESRRIHLNRSLVNLGDLTKKTQDLFQLQAKKNRIKTEFSCPSSLSKVWADPDRISQVFTNLLSNAFKFTPSGGKVFVKLSDERRHIKATVGDTGIGVYQSDQEKIFNRFEQADADSAGLRRKGSGLGLAIAKEIIHMHRGKIWVESSPGEGANFVFTLPKDVRAGRNKWKIKWLRR